VGLLLSASRTRLGLHARVRTTSCKVNYWEDEEIISSADIVVDYAVDWAIVQTQKWNTLYILSREREPAAATIDVSVYDLYSAPVPADITIGLDRPCCRIWLERLGDS
jgi:hypothetical protein